MDDGCEEEEGSEKMNRKERGVEMRTGCRGIEGGGEEMNRMEKGGREESDMKMRGIERMGRRRGLRGYGWEIEGG